MSKVIIGAGLGGTLPTLCTLAASYSANPTQPLPGMGMGLALVLFFVIGAAVAYGLDESVPKKAFVLGVAAPAVVSSIISGVVNAKTSVSGPPAGSAAVLHHLSALLGISDTLAQAPAQVQGASAESRAISGRSLTVSPQIAGIGIASGTTLRVQFLSAKGEVLSDNAVSALGSSTLRVPGGATVAAVSVSNVGAKVTLPMTFDSAQLDALITAQPANDFLWALSGKRYADIQNISLSVTDFKLPPPAAKPRFDTAGFVAQLKTILAAQPQNQLYVRGSEHDIPAAKLRSAIQSRSANSRPDPVSVIALLDTTVLGGASLHLLFTSDGMYFRTSALTSKGKKEGFIAYRDFTNLEFKKAAYDEVGLWDPLESTCRHASLSIL